MNIKEVEVRTGLERANIYFYEKEGLITPARLSNGYRDYSEEDLKILMKIKLLRSLHISLEDIRALKDGNISLRTAMEQQISELEKEEEKANYARSLCQNIRNTETSFQHLNAEKYLNGTAPILKKEENSYFSMPKDRVPYAACPIRRYLARLLDGNLYTIICTIVFCEIFGVSYSIIDRFGSIAFLVLGHLMMLVIEPILLRLFGTTLGKVIFGLHIRGVDGKKLSLREGYLRTRHAIFHLLILCIPIYSYYHLYLLYQDCMAEYKLPWEKDVPIAYTAKNESFLQPILFVCVHIVFFAALLSAFFMEILPPNRGDLTKEEFIENYVYYLSYYDYGSSDMIFNRRAGQWVDYPSTVITQKGYTVNGIKRDLYDETPTYHYETDADGHITSVSFTLIVEEDNPYIYLPKFHMHLISMSLGGAQKGFSWWPAKSDDLYEALQDDPFQTRTYTHPETGLVLDFQYITEGYPNIPIVSYHPALEPADPEQDNYFEMTFTCSKPTK